MSGGGVQHPSILIGLVLPSNILPIQIFEEQHDYCGVWARRVSWRSKRSGWFLSSQPSRISSPKLGCMHAVRQVLSILYLAQGLRRFGCAPCLGAAPPPRDAMGASRRARARCSGTLPSPAPGPPPRGALSPHPTWCDVALS